MVVADALFDGKKIRCLTIVDNYSRRCMAIHVDQGIKVVQVVKSLKDSAYSGMTAKKDTGG